MVKKWMRLCGWMGCLLGCYDRVKAEKSKSVQEVIAIALRKNLDIQMAKNDRKRAIWMYRKERLESWMPAVTWRLLQRHAWEKARLKDELQVDVNFKVAWRPIDVIFNNRIKHYEACKEDFIFVKNTAFFLKEVVDNFYDLVKEQKQWALLDMAVGKGTARLRKAEEELKLGLITRIDYLTYALKLKEQKLALLNHVETLRNQQYALNLKLGNPLEEGIVVDKVVSLAPTWEVASITKEQVVDRCTAIQVKERSRTKAALNKVKMFFLSSLSLEGTLPRYGYGVKEGPKDGLLHDANPALHIGLTWDIGNLLLLPAEIRAKKFDLHKANLALAKARLEVLHDFERQSMGYRQAIAQYKISQDTLNISKRKLNLVKEQYRLQLKTLLDVGEAAAKVQEAEMALIEKACVIKKAEWSLYQSDHNAIRRLIEQQS